MKRSFIIILLALCANAMAQVYGNLEATIVSPTALTAATVNTADQTNVAWRGGHFLVNVSAHTSGNYTPHIQGKDPVSGAYYDILVGPAISSTGTTVMKVYPGTTATPTQAVSDILPKTWRVQLIGAATPVMTLSIGASLGF